MQTLLPVERDLIALDRAERAIDSLSRLSQFGETFTARRSARRLLDRALTNRRAILRRLGDDD